VTTTCGSFSVDGYVCGDSNPGSVIFHPQGPGPFGVVIHKGGTSGEIDKMDDWLETIASLGMIVMAPFTGYGENNCHGSDGHGAAYKDMLRLLTAAYEHGSDLHPALASVDWQRVAFMGHSMGAYGAMDTTYQVRNSKHFNYTQRIKNVAVIASHDVSKNFAKLPARRTIHADETSLGFSVQTRSCISVCNHVS